MGIGYFACPATSPHLNSAERFVDFCLKPEIQVEYARKMKLSPVLPFDDLSLTQMEYEKVSTLGKVVTPASQVMVDRASDMQKNVATRVNALTLACFGELPVRRGKIIQ